MGRELLVTTDAGLYCPPGDFYIDPWAGVPQAVITHAHGDHARFGSNRYLTSTEGRGVLQDRLGPDARVDALSYREPLAINGVRLSLHPAGHILGSAQVRLEYRGEVWVVSGDYKLATDRTCSAFEPVKCHAFITESTFGLPIYHWPSQEKIFAEIDAWWRTNAAEGRASLVYAYSLGKAQRLLSGMDAGVGPIYCHGAVERMTRAYRRAGIDLPPTQHAAALDRKHDWAGALIVAPPSARGTHWLRRFGDFASAFASGWMQLRGARRRRAVERGFVLSDHSDWDGLLAAIRATGASRVMVTHGMVGPMVRWLDENGWEASPLATPFEGEQDESPEPETDVTEETAVDLPADTIAQATADEPAFRSEAAP